MKLLLYHYIHFYFISEFEVLFYVYYILPYEKTFINKLFTTNNLPYSVNSTTKIDIYNEYECKDNIENIDKYNENLINYCIYYVVIINILLFIILSFDFYILYKNYLLLYDKKNPSKLLLNISENQIISDETFIII
jgi:hypothetical protein